MAEQLQIADRPAPSLPDGGVGGTRWRQKGIIPLVVVTGLVIALTVVTLCIPVPREIAGLLVLSLMLALMFWGLHVGLAMGVAGLLGILVVSGPKAATTAIESIPHSSVASWQLSVLPMFILVGMLISESGLAARLYHGSRLWLGWVPGNLAVSSTLAGGGLAATSGSTLGITYALGRIGIPEMLKSGYSPRLTTGSVMVSGTLGQLIPPSILMVLYATVAQTPIGPQLMSGLIPGLIMAALYILLIVVWALVRPGDAPKEDQGSIAWGRRFAALGALWPLGALVLVVLGGMLSGFMTPTEAAAGGVITATLILLLKGRKGFVERFRASVSSALAATGSVFLLLIGTDLLSRAIAVSGIARWVVEALETMGLSSFTFLVIVGVAYLLLGTAIEPVPLMLMTIPVLLPAVEQFGISPIWFGVYVVLLGELGVLTPPIGILAFVVHKVASDRAVARIRTVSLNDVWMAALLFMPAPLVLAVLLLLFPGLATWLPDMLIRSSSP